MFQRAKVQKFESQSQPLHLRIGWLYKCFKEQKYKNLKANHNKNGFNSFLKLMFQRAKVQKFESQSQQFFSNNDIFI